MYFNILMMPEVLLTDESYPIDREIRHRHHTE